MITTSQTKSYEAPDIPGPSVGVDDEIRCASCDEWGSGEDMEESAMAGGMVCKRCKEMEG